MCVCVCVCGGGSETWNSKILRSVGKMQRSRSTTGVIRMVKYLCDLQYRTVLQVPESENLCRPRLLQLSVVGRVGRPESVRVGSLRSYAIRRTPHSVELLRI